jgi:hypothetical protein
MVNYSSDKSTDYAKILKKYGNSLESSLTKHLGDIKNSKFGKFIYDANVEGEFLKEAGETLRGIKEDFTYLARNVRNSVGKKTSKRYLPEAVGVMSSGVEGAVTFPVLERANSLIFNVVKTNGKLYEASTGKQLNCIEQNILYPLASTQLGPLPASSWLWLAGMAVTGGVTWYVSKKCLEKYLEKDVHES